MQLFARLVLNGVGVILQAAYVAFQALIFFMQSLYLLLQFMRIMPLLFKGGQTVLAKDDVITKRQCQGSGCDCGGAAALPVQHLAPVASAFEDRWPGRLWETASSLL